MPKINVNYVYTDMCVELIASKMSHKTRAYIDRKSRFSDANVLYDFDPKYDNEKPPLNDPIFTKVSTFESYKELYSNSTRSKLGIAF